MILRGARARTPVAQVLQRGVERADVREQLRDHDSVMLDREAALERVFELGIFARILPLDSSASCSASATPDKSASSIARADFEHVVEATLESLIPAIWSTLSRRWLVRERRRRVQPAQRADPQPRPQPGGHVELSQRHARRRHRRPVGHGRGGHIGPGAVEDAAWAGQVRHRRKRHIWRIPAGRWGC